MTDAINAELANLLAEARSVASAPDKSALERIYRRIVDAAPKDPGSLNSLGNEALKLGAPLGARQLFMAALKADPKAAPVWMNLALSERLARDFAAELRAMEAALAADPYFMVALVEKARWHELHGARAETIRAFRAVLSAAGDEQSATPALAQILAHARAVVSEDDEAIEREIRAAIGEGKALPRRFARALDIVAGRAKVFQPQPAGLHYPFLPAQEFFDRSLFPWFDKLEQHTAIIREELVTALTAGFSNAPYVRIAEGQPVNQWLRLNNSLDWGALFLWHNGVPNTPLLQACPRTAALIEDLPLMRIAGRGPTVMWSSLQPGAYIPPHNGATNTRAVVHLPLIVPERCMFRVGAETRNWVAGEAWAFDDTIEHEARNDSGDVRIILIADVWNPFLSEDERDLLTVAEQVLGRHGRQGE